MVYDVQPLTLKYVTYG